MKPLLRLLLVALAPLTLPGGETPAVRIEVQADRVLHTVSPHLTGACIEDVNHEIYGGIYSQMIFGESFQEPPITGLDGFTAYGGRWQVGNGDLQFTGTAGDKLVSGMPAFADGEAGVEVWVPDRRSVNLGLIVRVQKPGRGADNFDGYEIALDPAGQNVRLGRHRHNWELIRDTPCAVPTNRWVPLAVTLDGRTIEVRVGGQLALRHDDGAATLGPGTIGLRPFQAEARYRNLWVKTGAEARPVPFTSQFGPGADVSGMWRPVRTGDATGAWSIESERPFVGRQAQRIEFVRGEGRIGLENRGLNRWGLHFAAGKPYEGVLWARTDAPADLWVALENAEGSAVLAETPLPLRAGDWQRLTFVLTPAATVDGGRLAIALRRPGSVALGYVFLQPGEWGRFKGLPVRRDVAEALLDQGTTVLRYGGSMINHPEYRWKKMIGPRDRRPPYPGTWYPHSSNGWGILDFLDLCAAAGFLAIPAFNIGETPQDMADFIEYVHGPASSEWGRRRIADGHREPYWLRYLELGNEERVDEDYFRKFKPLAEAIWARDPKITIVVGDFAYGAPIGDPFRLQGAASGITTLAAQQKILELARQHDREVWFDVHIGTDGPRPDFGGTFSFIDALLTLAPGAKHRVVIFEFNAGNHSQRRALANAAAINRIERDGRIPIACSANCLQPDGQNDNDWNQGLLFLDPARVWLQPPGYVTRMFSRDYVPSQVYCQVTGAGTALDVNAKRSADGRTLVLQAVNPTDQTVATRLILAGFAPAGPTAAVTELAGPLDAVNTAARPDAILPQTRLWRHAIENGKTGYAFPPRSVTLLRFEGD
jgi:hypothetical protein